MNGKHPASDISARLVPCLLLIACAWRLIGVAPAQELTAPGRVVAEFHGTLLGVMRRAGELGYQGRCRELEPVIRDRFDIPLITDIVLGRYRNTLGEAERTEFTQLFARLSIATYAFRFNGYNGEEFVEIAREPLKRGRVLIRTELRRPDAEAIPLDYLLHERRGEWYIISVIADGVNDLSLKRAEYTAVMKEKGYNGLIAEISAKIHGMETEARPTSDDNE